VSADEIQRLRAIVEERRARLCALFRNFAVNIGGGVRFFESDAQTHIEGAEECLKAGDYNGCLYNLYRLLSRIDEMRDRVRRVVDWVVDEMKKAYVEGSG
jgi:hypothetical protein